MSARPSRSLTCLEYREQLQAGAFSAVEGIRDYLESIREWDARGGALLETFEESALAAAADVDLRRARGEHPRDLEGIPFTAKGNLSTVEGTTTAASRILEGFRAPQDATAVRRCREAGAILVGKTNLDEFGMGSSCENSSVRVTRNPWDMERVPGGSSGGAAALAALGGGAFHLGSDTGGSIRQPASFCGVSGFKPTYGRVSRSGLLAFGSSLDQIGPLARSAADCELVVSVMAGPDPLDSTTRSEAPPSPLESVDVPARIGVPREFFGEGVAPEVAARVREAVAVFEAAGSPIEEVSLPSTHAANACYQVISTAEASSNLARYDGVRYGRRTAAPSDLDDLYRSSRAEGFGAEVKRRILLGTFVLSAGHYEAYYQRALLVRERIREDFAQAFGGVDILLGPTSPVSPFRLGERIDDPLALYACDVLTVSANLAGIPAISIPCGRDGEGLPVGLQILGPVGGDAAVLGTARLYQARSDHHRARPGEEPS